MKWWFFVCVVVLSTALIGCEEMVSQAPQPESDSPQKYSYKSEGIPVDDGVYGISGTVVGEVESLVRQTQRASGTMVGSGVGTYGSYFGPEFGGKGFVRLLVEDSDSHLAPEGQIVILKVTDTKGIVLLSGDYVDFFCRHQYEALAAVRKREVFDPEKLETWEIDYCRLKTPVIFRPTPNPDSPTE